MSAMADMSRAIRLELRKYGPILQDIPDEILRDYFIITQAFAMDLEEEIKRRKDAT